MPTVKQELGEWGERLVAEQCSCPRCKRLKTLRRLPPNFKCADVICDFCGYLAQVKAARVRNVERLEKRILGAAWGPQKERMNSGIYFSLFYVQMADIKRFAIFYLAAELQQPSLFRPRSPLSANARRAGWQGFVYETAGHEERFVRLA